MYHDLATKLVIKRNAAPGDSVTRTVEILPGNALLLCATIYQLIVDGPSPFVVVGIQTSNDGENWETDGINFLTFVEAGYQELRFESLASRYVRVSCISNGSVLGAVAAVGLNIADL